MYRRAKAGAGLWGTQNLVGRQSRLWEQTAAHAGTILPLGPCDDHELLWGQRESRTEGEGAWWWVKGPELTSEPTDSPQSCVCSGASEPTDSPQSCLCSRPSAHKSQDPLSRHWMSFLDRCEEAFLLRTFGVSGRELTFAHFISIHSPWRRSCLQERCDSWRWQEEEALQGRTTVHPMWIKQNETTKMVWRWKWGKEFIIKVMLEGISPVWKKTMVRLQEPQQEKLWRSHVEI